MDKLHLDPIAALRAWPLFSLFDESWLGEWTALARRQIWDVGETIFTGGTTARELFLILAGRIRVFKKRSNGEPCSLGACNSGEVVGDYGLLPPRMLTASCRASSRAKTLALPLGTLQLRLEADVKQTLRAWVRLHFALRFAREQSCLGFMSPQSFLPLADCFETCEFEPGMAIQAPGLSDQVGFVIREGTVRLDDPRRPAGQQASDMLGPGECFGMQTILQKSPRQATAVERVRCWSVSRENFFDPMSRMHELSGQSLHPSGIQSKSISIPFVRQRDVHDCGVAALTMALCCRQRSIQYDDVRAYVPLGSKGAGMEALAGACRALGFQSTTVKTAVQQLANVSLPCIAHYVSDHYVAILEVSGDTLTIADPAQGVQQLGRSDFIHRWSGSLLLVAPVAAGG